MACPLCLNHEKTESYLPSTFFNNKRFDYIRCTLCQTVYINPIPTDEDYLAMYSSSYQSGADLTIHGDPETKQSGLRYCYQNQWDMITKWVQSPVILDYGCGSANFLFNSIQRGFHCDGAEYNPSLVAELKAAIPQANFYTIDEVFMGIIPRTYNVIRMSNVFEHLVDPVSVMSQLKNLLTEDGIILVEGPIEDNRNIAFLFRKTNFKLKKLFKNKHMESHPPYHVIYTNSKNQIQFFEKLGFEKLHYEVSESEWPFPDLSQVNSLTDYFKNLIARFSIRISHLFSSWGNTFMYVGKK